MSDTWNPLPNGGSLAPSPSVTPFRHVAGLARLLPALCCALYCALASAATSFPPTMLGGAASTQPVTVTVTNAATLSAIRVLTLGQPGLDYTTQPGGSCQTGNAYAQGAQCTVTVSFGPLYAGVRPGAVVLLDASGTPMGTQLLTGTGDGAQGVFVPGMIATVAGDGQFTSVNDGSAATSASLKLPAGVAVDGVGNLYIADSADYRIRKVTAATGIISTYAGNGTQGDTGDNGPATAAEIGSPQGLALDGAGNLYFADSAASVVRRIDGATGIITTVAGAAGSQGAGGDGGPATAATLYAPTGVTVGAAGTLYIADTGNGRIRAVDAATGIIHTVAGGGAPSANQGDGGPATAAFLNKPGSVAFDTAGNLYIPDSGNNRVRRVDAATANISTVAGNGMQGFGGDGGAPLAAQLYSPLSVAVDPAGNLYIADTQNYRIRKVVNNVIDTIAGDGSQTSSGDGGVATRAGIYAPYFVYLDSAGDLLTAEYFDNRIREISSNAVTLLFPDAIRVGQKSPPQPEVIENDGNLPLTFAGITPDANAATDAATTTCQPSNSLSPDQSCTIGAEFAPTQVGNPVDGHIASTGNMGDSPLTITVVGQSLPLTSTSTTLLSLANPSTYGQAVQFVATVDTGAGTPAGTVTFNDGATALGTGAVSGSGTSGTASFTISSLAPGLHSITASYGGDSQHGVSTSAPLAQTVNAQTATTLASSANPATVTSPVTLTAQVTQTGGAPSSPSTAPSGTVVFEDGGNVLGTPTLDASGRATLTTSTLTVGTHALTATYNGGTYNLASTSATLNQVIGKESTATTLSSSSNPSVFGIAVTYTAAVAVTGSGSGTPGGTVTLLDGGVQIATGTLGSGATVTFSIASLSAGTHTLTAQYGGDSNNNSSTAAALSQVITQAQTADAGSYSPNPAIAGKLVTLSVTVTNTSGAGTPTGTVSFANGGTQLGTATLSGGNGSITSTFGPGSPTLTLTYSGDANHAGSTASLPLTVQQAMTTTTVTGSSPDPSGLGAPVSFNVSVAGNGGTPTGTVTVLADGSSLGSGPVIHGAATVTSAALAVGTHQITAGYSGDTDDAPSATTQSYVQTVNKAPTTLSLASAPNPATAGATITLTATVHTASGLPAPAGIVQFSDGASNLGQAPVTSSGTATFSTSTLGPGQHTLQASYSGDTNYTGATSSLGQDVQLSTTATLASSANPSIAGTSVSFTMTVHGAGATPTGTVTLLDGATTLAVRPLNGAATATYATSSLSAGTHTLTASYAGDANNAPATSPALAQVVQQATTTTGLSTSANPSIAGKALIITAAVAGNGPAPTGTVRIFDGAQLLGTATIGGSGQAVLSTAALAPGTHALTATYAGDTNNQGSSSSPVSVLVQQATTSLAFSASANPAVVTRTVLLTATVVSNGGTPGGIVSFSFGSTVLGSAALTAAGTATVSVSTLPLGADALLATYAGDTNDAGSQGQLVETIQQSAPTVTLQTSRTPSLVGAPVTLTATLANLAASFSGSVTFASDGAALGSASVGSNGAAVITTSALTLGTHVLTAVYSGDTNNAAASAPPLTEVVQQTTTTQLTAAPNPQLGGTPLALVASVAAANGAQATGTVTFYDGTANLGSATLAGNTATLSVSSLAVGSHSLVAVYAGDTLDAGSSSAPLLEAVQSAATAVALSTSGSPALLGSAVTFTAQVTGNGAHLTGKVTFTDAGLPLGTTPLGASGQATLVTSSLLVGTHSILAGYNGDSNHTASRSGVLAQVVQSPTVTTLAVAPPTSVATQMVTLTGRVASTAGTQPGGTLTFTDGTMVLGTGTLNAAGEATLAVSSLPSGTHTLVATYSGDTLDAPSTSAPATETVGAIPTNTHLGGSPASVATNDPLTLIAAVTSNYSAPFRGTVTFKIGSTVIGQSPVDASGTATLAPSLGAGVYDLVASYSGDAFNAPSTSAPFHLTVTQAPDFSVTVNSSSLTVQSKQNTTLTLTIHSLAGFSDQIGLGCASLPARVSCTFSRTAVSLAPNGTMQLQLTVDTSAPLTGGGVAGLALPGGPGVAGEVRDAHVAVGLLLPLPGLLALVLTRRRQARRLGGLLIFSVVGIVLISLSGCNALSVNGTSPGTYQFQVIGTGISTGVTHTVDLSLSVH